MKTDCFINSLLICLLCLSCGDLAQSNQENSSNKSTEKMTKTIDWQGHRGARGLLPENTIPSFIKALEYNVKTLELDIVVSKDSQIIVSHEPWFSHHICTKPNGEPVLESEAKSLLIYEMTYEEIKKYDCGMRGNERFPDQQKMKVFKPSFMEMVANVDLYCEQNKIEKPFFNVEIKSQESYYNKMTPAPEKYVSLILEEIKLLNLEKRVNLQSFDFNILRAIKKQNPRISMAMLIENVKSVEHNLEDLGFTPDIYSPYYMLLNENVIEEIHKAGMRVIPWTVNDPLAMKKLVENGVDGIITDYPNLIPR